MEIKFRAYAADADKFIYSSGGMSLEKFFEYVEDWCCEVDRWTGLYTEEDEEIYENDIIDHVVKIVDEPPHFGNKGVREIVTITPWGSNIEKYHYEWTVRPTIVGNIYQNKELIA